MAEVVQIPKKVEREPVQSVVQLLERLLDRAQRGDIRAFAYAVVRNGFWTEEGTRSAEDEPLGPSIIGAVAILHARLTHDKLMDSIEGEEV